MQQDGELYRTLLALPKVELHRHLEGSVRLATLAEHLPVAHRDTLLASHNGDALAAAREWFCIIRPVASLTECMQLFVRLADVFDSISTVERIAYEVCEDAARENVRVLELRYSPGYVAMQHKLDLEAIHRAVCAGIARAQGSFPHLAVGLIGILDRFASEDEAMQMTDFILTHREFIGLDLANDELTFCDRVFQVCFDRAHAAGLGITVHNGEVDTPEAPSWVLRAVNQQHARRIGHGIHVVKDVGAVASVRDAGIVFEVCPSSNLLTKAVRSFAEHPLRSMLDLGLKVTLSTDDPGLFCLTLTGELYVAVAECGLTLQEIEQAQLTALAASFLPQDIKHTAWTAAT